MSFVTGLLFALGLGVAGMTQPRNIIAFLDFFGDWDPGLAFVMAGAVMVYAVAQALVSKRAAPVFETVFRLPDRQDVDRPLLVGAALFGTGWGLAGFCPAPAIVALVTGNLSVIVFVVAMVAGMYAFDLLTARPGAVSGARA